MDLAERLGIRIQYLRNQKGMTQAQVCASGRLTQPQLSQIEKGRMWLRIDTIEAICRGLHIEPEELFKTVHLDIH
jgi:transcriptional regulator with XRE-family HTH domain